MGPGRCCAAGHGGPPVPLPPGCGRAVQKFYSAPHPAMAFNGDGSEGAGPQVTGHAATSSQGLKARPAGLPQVTPTGKAHTLQAPGLGLRAPPSRSLTQGRGQAARNAREPQWVSGGWPRLGAEADISDNQFLSRFQETAEGTGRMRLAVWSGCHCLQGWRSCHLGLSHQE